MAVPMFTIDASIKQLYQDSIDTVIQQLGKDCQLVMDGPGGPCPNCGYNPLRRASDNTYNGTGPVPFTHPPCPVCKGTGLDPAKTTVVEVRRFSIRRNIRPSQVIQPPGNLTRPASFAKIKGMATDMPLVLQAKYIVLDYQNAKYVSEKYITISDPGNTGNIVAGRYFECLLQRAA